MFVTLVLENSRLAAQVHFEDSRVHISASQDSLRAILREVYRPNMTPLEFARANYQLNRYRPQGITWELVLSEEYKASGN